MWGKRINVYSVLEVTMGIPKPPQEVRNTQRLLNSETEFQGEMSEKCCRGVVKEPTGRACSVRSYCTSERPVRRAMPGLQFHGTNTGADPDPVPAHSESISKDMSSLCNAILAHRGLHVRAEASEHRRGGCLDLSSVVYCQNDFTLASAISVDGILNTEKRPLLALDGNPSSETLKAELENFRAPKCP